MSRVIHVTWAPEAVREAVERGTAALKQIDEANPNVAHLVVTDLACLLDLAQHAVREHDKISKALDYAMACIARWQREGLDNHEAAVTDLETVMDILL